MKTRVSVCLLVLLSLLPSSAGAWGGDVHRLINRSAVECLPPDFQGVQPMGGDSRAALHRSRRAQGAFPGSRSATTSTSTTTPSSSPAPSPTTTRPWSPATAATRVISNGTLPWAIDETYRNLVTAFQAKNWTQAVALAGDIGHYVGDLHNPLHDTVNYDGDLTGQSGIHSRFESKMTVHLHELPHPETGAGASRCATCSTPPSTGSTRSIPG